MTVIPTNSLSPSLSKKVALRLSHLGLMVKVSVSQENKSI